MPSIYRLCVLTQIFVFRIPFNVELVFDYMCGDKVPCNIVSCNDVDWYKRNFVVFRALYYQLFVFDG